MSNDHSITPELTNLKVGYTFDYNLKTWIVEEVYHYKWGNNFSSIEYKIYSGDEEAYLEVEDDDELKILFSKNIDIPLSSYDFSPGSSPKPSITHQGKQYDFNEMFESQARNDEDDYWESFYLWDYFDAEGKEFISVENWDGDIEACHGHVVNELEISNITPGDPNRVRERNIQRKFGYDSTYPENGGKNEMPGKILFVMFIIIILIIFFSRGCGGTYVHTGKSGRYIHHTTNGGGGSWSGGGGFRGGGGGFGK